MVTKKWLQKEKERLQNHRERDLVTKPQRVTKNQGCILVTKP
jgi:hypothetical protein